MILALMNAARTQGGAIQRVAHDAYTRAVETVTDCGGDLREWFVHEIRCVTDFDTEDARTCAWFREWI